MDPKVNAETMRHILTVRAMLLESAHELCVRARNHDASKLEDPEATGFAVYTNKLKDLDYGSDEYTQCLADMQEFLEHHYQHNAHHPEHHERGIQGMNLFDLLEMLCDWKSSTLRHKTGCIHASLDMNRQRFDMSDSLYEILKNTLDVIENMADIANIKASYPLD